MSTPLNTGARAQADEPHFSPRSPVSVTSAFLRGVTPQPVRSSSDRSIDLRRQSPQRRGPLERLAEDGQLAPIVMTPSGSRMDTIREKQFLEARWQDEGRSPLEDLGEFEFE